MCDTIKHTNKHNQSTRRGEECEKEKKQVLKKIMTENFPNLLKNNNLNIQEAQQIPSRIN